MNIKKITFQFFTLLTVLAVAITFNYVSAQWSAPTGTAPTNNTPIPLNVGTTAQIKNGGLDVNAFSAKGLAWFDQNTSFKGSIGGVTGTASAPVVAPLSVSTDLKVAPLADSSGADFGKLCTDSSGKVSRCSANVPSCPDPNSGAVYFGAPASGECPSQVGYYSPGTWVNPSYASAYSLCSSNTTPWQNYTGSTITVTNKGAFARDYLVLGQAFVGNDSGADILAYMLKEGNPTAYTHTNVIGFDQVMIDYSPPGAPTGRPAALQVMSVETIPAGASKTFNGWVQEVHGGCGLVYGMKTTAIPL